jgi:DnaJ-domain-containing protein 1
VPDNPAMPSDIARTERRLRELAFLHEIAQLATQARDWDELMRAIVDGTTTALEVEVCSF